MFKGGEKIGREFRVKKAQEEMVGFALIIIIVAIIALVLLALASRKPVSVGEDRALANFLNSMALYTTNCSVSPERFLSMKELIRACAFDEQCLGKRACEVMNETLVALLREAFPSGREEVFFYGEYNATASLRRIFTFGNISCSGERRGAELFYPANPGTITLVLQGCY